MPLPNIDPGHNKPPKSATTSTEDNTNSKSHTIAEMSQNMLRANRMNSTSNSVTYGGGSNGAGVQFAWRFYGNSKRSTVARSLPEQLAQTPSLDQPPCCLPGLAPDPAKPWKPDCLPVPHSANAVSPHPLPWAPLPIFLAGARTLSRQQGCPSARRGERGWRHW